MPKRPRAIVTPDGEFDSPRAAALHHGIRRSTAAARALQQLGGWRYEGDAIRPKRPRGRPRLRPEPPPRADKQKKRPVVTPAGEYPSITAAAKAHGIGKPSAHRLAQEQRKGWRFAGEAIRLPAPPPPPKPQRGMPPQDVPPAPPMPPTRKKGAGRYAVPVVTPAGPFPSIAEAAAHYGIPTPQARKLAEWERHGWRYDLSLVPPKPSPDQRVITPDGEFDSAREAAGFYSVPLDRIMRHASRGKSGWRFVPSTGQARSEGAEGVSGVPKAGPVT